MHADQRAAVERVREKAGRKGVTDLLPPWLLLPDTDNRGWDTGINKEVSDDAAALIVTGALAKWLAGQGIAVMQKQNRGWIMACDDGLYNWLMHATDHISALLAATLARLAELPDKEKA